MAKQRNGEGITPAAARVVARMSPRFGQWGVERRLRDQLEGAGLATVEHHGRETRTRLTDLGKQCRKTYRRAGLHKLPPIFTPEEKAEWAAALAEIGSAAVAVMSFI
jgi:hypothetical protein